MSNYHQRLVQLKFRPILKAFLVHIVGHCQVCFYNRYIGNLTFHHQNPANKKYNISESLLLYSLPQLIIEASKCIIVCHNCHNEINAKLLDVSHIPTLDYSNVTIPTNLLNWYEHYASTINQRIQQNRQTTNTVIDGNAKTKTKTLTQGRSHAQKCRCTQTRNLCRHST